MDGEEPDQQRVTEATGNEGASYERSYHRAALVLWPHERFGEVLMQAGVLAAIPFLGQKIEAWQRDHKARKQGKAWKELVKLADAIIDRWEVPGPCRYVQEDEKERSRSHLLRLFSAMGDEARMVRLLEEVVLPEYVGSENEGLAVAARLLRAEETTRAFLSMVEAYFANRPGACVDLLERLVEVEGLSLALSLPP